MMTFDSSTNWFCKCKTTSVLPNLMHAYITIKQQFHLCNKRNGNFFSLMCNIKCRIHYRFRTTSTRSLCWIFSVCIKRWEHWWFISVLQGRSFVTNSKFYNNLYHIRALRHFLQWEIGWSYLPWRLRSVRQCLNGAVWGICKR